jgi:hypothetical protein
LPQSGERGFPSEVKDFISFFGRISGAKRRKPGYPLQQKPLFLEAEFGASPKLRNQKTRRGVFVPLLSLARAEWLRHSALGVWGRAPNSENQLVSLLYIGSNTTQSLLKNKVTIQP